MSSLLYICRNKKEGYEDDNAYRTNEEAQKRADYLNQFREKNEQWTIRIIRLIE